MSPRILRNVLIGATLSLSVACASGSAQGGSDTTPTPAEGESDTTNATPQGVETSEPATNLSHPFAPKGEATLPTLSPTVVFVSSQLSVPSTWPDADKIASEFQIKAPVELSERDYLNLRRETKLSPSDAITSDTYAENKFTSVHDLTLMGPPFVKLGEVLGQKYGEQGFEERIAKFKCMLGSADAGTAILVCLSPPTDESESASIAQRSWLVFEMYHGDMPPNG